MTAPTPTHVRLIKSEQTGNKLYISRMFEYDVSDEIKKRASDVLNKWLRRARLALRIRGSHKDYPLASSETVARELTNSRNPRYAMSYYKGDEVLFPSHAVEFKNADGVNIDPVVDIILQGKVDIASLTIAFRRICHGHQKWDNVANRARSEFKPEIMYHLINGAKLEDS
jgi:hypothetical protein